MRKLTSGWGIVASLILALWASPPATAQQGGARLADYEYIPILESIYSGGRETEALKGIARKVTQINNGELPLAQEESVYDKYYTMYLFAKMTQTDEKSLANLPRERTALMRNHIRNIRRQEVHDHLVQLTFRSMKDIATKNYHPAARYNAMLIIGDLNSKEPVLGASASLPLPYAEARDLMIAELLNPKQIDAVRVAALLGILRHVDINAHSTQQYPAAVRQGIVNQILPIALDRKIPADRSEEGHAWIRGRALEILAALGQAGFDNRIVQAINTIVADPKETLSVRIAAASSLGRLNLSAGANVSGEEIARNLANLAVQGTRELLAQLDEEIAYEKEQQRLAGGGVVSPTYSFESGRGPGFGGSGGVPLSPKMQKQEERMLMTQRVVKDRMYRIRQGIDGGSAEGLAGAMTAAKSPAAKEFVSRVRDASISLMRVGDLKDAKTNEVPKLNDLARELRTRINDLERVARTGGAPAPPPAEVTAAEGPDAEDPDAGVPAPPPARAAEGPEEGPE
jgi:hypothetical protein